MLRQKNKVHVLLTMLLKWDSVILKATADYSSQRYLLKTVKM